jgi:aryl-alcohol dehydrogenase-like predicted oxidoreductase
MRRFTDPRILEAVQQIRPIAEELGLSMSQLALAWVLREECVSAAIIGANDPEQIEENVGAIGVEIDHEALRKIDDVLDGAARR